MQPNYNKLPKGCNLFYFNISLFNKPFVMYFVMAFLRNEMVLSKYFVMAFIFPLLMC